MAEAPSSSSSSSPDAQSGAAGVEAWKAEVGAVALDKATVDRIVMNFLVVEGYQDVAEKFAREAGVEPEVPLSTIHERMLVRKDLHAGRVSDAVRRVNDINPDVLDTRGRLWFRLGCQRVIELIRGGDANLDEALAYAQEALAPLAANDAARLSELEDLMSLLAFPNPDTSPVGHLLEQSRREAVATELNEAILETQCESREPQLASLLKRLVYSQKQLAGRMPFAAVSDLSTASFENQATVAPAAAAAPAGAASNSHASPPHAQPARLPSFGSLRFSPSSS